MVNGKRLAIGNQDSNTGAAFEAERAEGALGYWGFGFAFELITGS